MFVFKVYSGKQENLVRVAEIAAAKIFEYIDPDHSVPVADFHWNNLSGTIQPYISGGLVRSTSALMHDPDSIVQILERQVADWVLSNHDGHINHILWRAGSPVYVDYGQVFKYFPNDVLSSTYHPNAIRGQVEPFYNVLHRNVLLTERSKKAILERAAEIAGTSEETFWEFLRPYAEERFVAPSDQDDFIDAVRSRVANVSAVFSCFYEQSG